MSVFSHDDDDIRGNYISKDDPQFEFNPFSTSNMPVFENDNGEVKKDQDSAEFLKFEEPTDAKIDQK